MTKKGLVVFAIAALAFAGFAPGASALHSNQHYTLFDDAAYVSPGNSSNRAVHLISDASPGFGGIDYGIESGLTFADIDALSTDYRFEGDDSCGGGSPRFQIGVASSTGDTGNIFVYLGPSPNYTLCAPSVWTNSGDLLASGKTVDTSQLDNGTFYHSYDDAVADYGNYSVTSIELVADAGWAFNDAEQAVDIDNTTVDATLFTYELPVAENGNQCKNGGWRNMTDDNGRSFRNQGDCVSFTASGGRNQANGS